MIENATPFSPECFILFSPNLYLLIWKSNKRRMFKNNEPAMKKSMLLQKIFMIQLWIESKKTNNVTIGNGVSLLHGFTDSG